MSSSLLRTLLLPLLVAAALLPRGVRLEWCICEASGPVSCCEPASCCDAPAKEPSAEDAREGGADCASCCDFEVEPFDEDLPASLVVTLEVPAASGLEMTLAPRPAAALLPASLRGRAPPGSVVPTGQLPGTAPLRI